MPFIDHHVPLFIYKKETLIPLDIEKLYDDDYYLGWIRAYKEGRNTLVEWETYLLKENQRILQMIQRQL